jgi:hypothetical protein
MFRMVRIKTFVFILTILLYPYILFSAYIKQITLVNCGRHETQNCPEE